MLRYRIGGLYLEDVALRALGEHRKIFDFVRKKDKQGVASAKEHHLEMVKQSVQDNAFKDKKTGGRR